MRIRRSSSWESRGFWAETMGWLRSRAGLAQFLLAAGIGLAIAVAAGLLYRQIGHAVLEPIIDALRAEAEDTIKAALGDNDLPDLRLDIAFEEYQIMAAQRQCARDEGILLCPEGAATLAALKQELASGRISRDERVVLFNCATGLKYPMQGKVATIDLGQPIDYQWIESFSNP